MSKDETKLVKRSDKC
jgi:hypothetical protein